MCMEKLFLIESSPSQQGLSKMRLLFASFRTSQLKTRSIILKVWEARSPLHAAKKYECFESLRES